MTENDRVGESNHGKDVVISHVSEEGKTNGQRERWMKGVRENKIYDCLPHNTSYLLSFMGSKQTSGNAISLHQYL